MVEEFFSIDRDRDCGLVWFGFLVYEMDRFRDRWMDEITRAWSAIIIIIIQEHYKSRLLFVFP